MMVSFLFNPKSNISMKTAIKKKTLSDIPSEAIQQSLDDMQACQDNGWTINMAVWVDEDECEVCQAGAIMLNRFGYTSIEDFGDREALLKTRVRGFNDLRFLSIYSFLADGFEVNDDLACQIQAEVDDGPLDSWRLLGYEEPDYFDEAMQTVIDILKTHNL